MKKTPTQIKTRDKISIAQGVLEHSEVAHFLSPPLGTLEESIRASSEARAERERVFPDLETFPIIERLRGGDFEPFFHALRYDPTILLSPPIWRMTIGAWFRRKHEDKTAQLLLKKLSSALAFTGGEH